MAPQPRDCSTVGFVPLGYN